MKNKSFGLKLPAVVIVLAALLPAAYFFGTYRSIVNRVDPKTVDQETLPESAADIVNKLVVVPGDEAPEQLTVPKASHLPANFIFKQAQENDIVLLYQHAGQAILYRPSTGKIIAEYPADSFRKR